ncbi:MAG: hypothetical protein E4G91_05545 [Candidatus Zixiibacteriota bacterium]|nr:MAG: hypothetical protein E4G91_05545 [candidate division Zixibacteria bacterium]
MAFCPKCRYEYQPGIDICPDCDEKLVPELPVESPMDETDEDVGDWVPLVRLTSHDYAEMVLTRLRDMQIPAVILSGAGHFGTTGQMGTSSYRAVGGAFTIAVPEEYVEEADTQGEFLLGEIWVKSRLEEEE